MVIGIEDYQHVPPPKYAANDAKAFYQHPVNRTQIPGENVTLLLDREASLSRLRSTLGTHLKNKAGKEDMVILYFAGRGATETDVQSPDGDGLEKYLLPYDAGPKDLYASAIPMRELPYIFNRIRSERLVFIVDACYSGASGGRTIPAGTFRASISEASLRHGDIIGPFCAKGILHRRWLLNFRTTHCVYFVPTGPLPDFPNDFWIDMQNPSFLYSVALYPSSPHLTGPFVRVESR